MPIVGSQTSVPPLPPLPELPPLDEVPPLPPLPPLDEVPPLPPLPPLEVVPPDVELPAEAARVTVVVVAIVATAGDGSQDPNEHAEQDSVKLHGVLRALDALPAPPFKGMAIEHPF